MDWEFYYKGWHRVREVRDGAMPRFFSLEARKGTLDGDMLSKGGLTTARTIEGDDLFFNQLLLPICDPKRSGIQGDYRQSFFSEVEGFTNLYAYSIGLGGSYGHKFKTVDLPLYS